MKSFLVRCFLLTALVVLSVSSLATAARANNLAELSYFQTKETKVAGQDVFRIEIGAKADELKYAVSTKPYFARQIIVDINNARQGKLRSSINLKSELARRVNIQDMPDGHAQIRITCNQDVEEGSYKVYTLPADRKQGTPTRIVIDIMKEAAPSVSTSGVGSVKGHKIAIDPGHGGSDSGAVGPRGVTEKSVTLAVSQKVRSILEGSGARVIMTRDTDRDVYGVNATDKQELQARVDVGTREPGVEIFVSIHCNAFSNSEASGTETYYYASSAQGKKLATLLNEELIKAGGRTNRGVKTANFYVIRHSPMPASLVELAFVTNYEEERLLSDPQYQDRLATAIARAISRYFGQ